MNRITPDVPRHIVVAMTGASGALYGLELVRALLASGCRVSLLLSAAAHQVLQLEQGLNWSQEPAVFQRLAREYFADQTGHLCCYGAQDFSAPVASGSAAADAMVVIPASMGSVARFALGISSSLIERTADVMLKERRPLIVVPRETPLSTIHLRNLLTLAEAGAVVLPAMPAFYSQPQSLLDLVHFVVGKVLDQLHLGHDLFTRWGETSAPDGETPPAI
ncbi:MAG: UbiX family flavin prenyltransferase [Desulfuromonadaceae bacterium]|nr:UbiX family flavin prenyltransferase [Desulfuromonadaceae bacterium]